MEDRSHHGKAAIPLKIDTQFQHRHTYMVELDSWPLGLLQHHITGYTRQVVMCFPRSEKCLRHCGVIGVSREKYRAACDRHLRL